MKEVTGWLCDLYSHPQKGIVLWLAGEDGKPHCLFQDFETTFYAGGPAARVHELGVFLRSKYSIEKVKFERVTKEDLFAGPQEVMGVRVANPTIHRRVFREANEHFPDLIYSDVDTPLSIRYAAAKDVFMMAHCKVTAESEGKLVSIVALDKPDDLEPKLPRLRILSIRPDTDPAHGTPKNLIVRFKKFYLRAPLDQPRELLGLLNSILSTYDPDVIRTHYGDAWLFPHLEALSKETGIPFNPNRDLSMPVLRRKEISFFNYGQAHYRGPQVHLRGRWHVDVENCMTYNQYRLLGAIEQVRLSSLPLQEVARRSPGAAIAAMQDLVAVRRGVLVPYQRQKGEIPKTYNQLVRADRGGLVFQPVPGIFKNVAILDFSSMMASIMIEFNVSPETVGMEEDGALEIPELGIKISSRLGLVPQTLKPMRDKRLALKRLLRSLDKSDPRFQHTYNRYKSVADGIKWLTVVCYGRLGFANSRFGLINAHEVVSYLSRKVITQARSIAEAKGFDVLHLYVDSLFVSKPDASAVDFQDLAEEIERGTHLPMDFDGTIFPWFAFLGSRENPNRSVANRFYGLSPDGEHKIRGIALRRRDTSRFAANTQMQVLNILAKEKDPAKLTKLLPEVLAVAQEQFKALKNKEVPLEELVVRQTLSREINEYTHSATTAIAARQLQSHGKTIKRGQSIRFIYVAPGPGVRAWDLPILPDPKSIDVLRYKELVLRAVYEVLQPIGVTEKTLRDWLFSRAGYLAQPGVLPSSKQPDGVNLPLLANLDYLRIDY
jgi:DNA polymerase-2